MRKTALLLVCLLLLAANVLVWVSVLSAQKPVLSVFVLDVGQGDAILIQSPTGTEVLIDGGRDRSALRALPKALGLFDRSIDLIIETHPDQDHIGGLPGVFARYKVGAFMGNGVENGTNALSALHASVVGEDNVEDIRAKRGERISLGGGAFLDILYPDRDVSGLETNMGSVVARLSYGSTSFMLTGDAPTAVEDWLIALDGNSLRSTVLKAGHHGSKTSTGEAWLAVVDPAYVAISVGKDNTYGHPSPVVMDRIRAHHIPALLTMDEGTIHFVSDGETVTVR